MKIIGLSADPVGHHAEWARDIEQTQGQALNYPLIGDGDFVSGDQHSVPARARIAGEGFRMLQLLLLTARYLG